MVMRKSAVTVEQFVTLLREHCFGDWWDKVLPVVPEPEYYACEDCGYHPLTEEHAAKFNKLFARIRELNGPAPTSFYPWCENDLFVDWYSEDGKTNLIWLDFNNRFGTDALVRIGNNPIYFVDVEI